MKLTRRKFLGWFGKAAAVAVLAPQVLAEVKPVTNKSWTGVSDKFTDFSGGKLTYLGDITPEDITWKFAENVAKTKEQMISDIFNKA